VAGDSDNDGVIPGLIMRIRSHMDIIIDKLHGSGETEKAEVIDGASQLYVCVPVIFHQILKFTVKFPCLGAVLLLDWNHWEPVTVEWSRVLGSDNELWRSLCKCDICHSIRRLWSFCLTSLYNLDFRVTKGSNVSAMVHWLAQVPRSGSSGKRISSHNNNLVDPFQVALLKALRFSQRVNFSMRFAGVAEIFCITASMLLCCR